MNKLIIALTIILMATSAQAQTRKSLKDIDKELKQTKSTATAMALIESIGETTPQTDEDVATLGQLMDKYPTQGHKALNKISDKKLSGAVIKECGRQTKKLKAARSKGESNLTVQDRQDYLNGYMNSAAAINVLAKLNSKDAIPALRGYLQDEDLSRFASLALGRLGDSESLNGMIGNMGHGKNVDLSGYGDKGLVRVVEELDKPDSDVKRKDALIGQIKGSASPERKRLLKDLALKHQDSRVRDRAGLALLNSIMVNPEAGDNAFIAEWVDRTKNDETGYWAVTSISVSHGNGAKPLDKNNIAILVDVLRTSTYSPTRSEAAQGLGMFKVQEALPYLEECLAKDKDANIRGHCRESYWKISGKVPAVFHPEDVITTGENLSNPEAEKNISGLRKNDPARLFREARRKAYEEYMLNHK